jgi:NTE family protein
MMHARTPFSETAVSPHWRPEGCDRVALVLQGGGALGAYQAGVYQPLHESGMEPDWVCGVSIGAINSAIIAGNPPERRLERLHTFWDRITARKVWHYTPDGDVYRKARNMTSSFMTSALGQPGFFKPHDMNPWLSPAVRAPRPAITTRRRCARLCSSWLISIASTAARCILLSAR